VVPGYTKASKTANATASATDSEEDKISPKRPAENPFGALLVKK